VGKLLAPVTINAMPYEWAIEQLSILVRKNLATLGFLDFFGHYNLEPAGRCVLLRGSLTPSKR
jgi:hypothetical protein